MEPKLDQDDRMERNDKGTDFESRVAKLLRSATGYRNVREQQHLRGKNVDIIFEKQWNPHRYLTIGVECKNWKSGLDREAIKSIYFDYEPLLAKNDIDELWIVTPAPAGPTVQEHTNDMPKLVLLHISELEQDIIDFTLYASYLKDSFKKSPLPNFYIQSRINGRKRTLHSKIIEWLSKEQSQPIAIWAGYGMGKTSYAAFLASELAEQFLSNSASRIPILIPLGDYYTAPRLDGLFANVLTKDHGVHGYNYNTFWNLHDSGRFVIILDGFDEMKHAMNTSEFIAISRQIRSLILPNSKVLLLGRPDAIVSGEEHNILIRGRRRVSGVEFTEDSGQNFDEVRIDFFTQPEYVEFLRRYISFFYKGSDKNEFIEQRIEEIKRLKLDDILRRPVQARMLAQILLNPSNIIENITKYDLYSIFIEECLQREEEKPERTKTSTKLRRKFMQDLAWWLWAFKRTRTFSVNELPAPIFDAFLIHKGDNPAGQLRELLVGSVVEEKSIGSIVNEKDAGTFYFPHLSFTEFLVAEYLIERELTEQDFSVLVDSLGGEVKEFLRGYRKSDALYKLYKEIGSIKGSVYWDVIMFIAESRRLSRGVTSRIEGKVGPIWQFAIDIGVLIRNKSFDVVLPKCIGTVDTQEFDYAAAAIQILFILGLEYQKRKEELFAAFIAAAFKGVRVNKIIDTIGKIHSSYNIAGATEDFCVDLLTDVAISSEGVFEFDIPKMHTRVFGPKLIASKTPTREGRIFVKAADVRRWLRPRDERPSFDKLVETTKRMRGGNIFESGRQSWEPAKTVVRLGP